MGSCIKRDSWLRSGPPRRGGRRAHRGVRPLVTQLIPQISHQDLSHRDHTQAEKGVGHLQIRWMKGNPPSQRPRQVPEPPQPRLGHDTKSAGLVVCCPHDKHRHRNLLELHLHQPDEACRLQRCNEVRVGLQNALKQLRQRRRERRSHEPNPRQILDTTPDHCVRGFRGRQRRVKHGAPQPWWAHCGRNPRGRRSCSPGDQGRVNCPFWHIIPQRPGRI